MVITSFVLLRFFSKHCGNFVHNLILLYNLETYQSLELFKFYIKADYIKNIKAFKTWLYDI